MITGKNNCFLTKNVRLCTQKIIDVFDLTLVLLANQIVAFLPLKLQFIVQIFSLDFVCAPTKLV